VGLVATALLAGCAPGKTDRAIAQHIKRSLVGRFPWSHLPTVDDDDIQPLLRRFYRARRYRPAWVHATGPSAQAREMLKRFAHARDHGLDPDDYELDDLKRMMKHSGWGLPVGPEGDPRALAALDVELSRNALKYAIHVTSGQVDPRELPADWHFPRRRADVVAVLEQALTQHRVVAALDELEPRDPRYVELQKALVRYRTFATEHGRWPRVAPGPTLRRGQSGARVDSLRARLMATEDLPAGSLVHGSFDAATEAAVRRFQSRHGLVGDGVVKTADVEQLDVTLARRIRQIELNLERWRWLPDSLLGDRYLLVNVPDFTLQVFEGGRPSLSMRVVVGKQYSRTPLFTDEISYLVFNPYWNIPPTIAAQEILDEIKHDPDYLTKNGMRVFESDAADAREIDPKSVYWWAFSPQTFSYSIRQDPGPQNPVGHVKFMCPNQFDVYLHDTPAGHLFDRRERDFSHGCIRVEHPVDLAELLLGDVPGWSRHHITAAFDSSHNEAVKLRRPMPVFILYWTSWVDSQGLVNFRDDVYELDAMLQQCLRRRGRPDIRTLLTPVITSPPAHDAPAAFSPSTR
jgi:murein L,D-transpeptidase YcbB/YkuD